MVLNYIWIAFFLIAFVVATGRLVIGGDTAVFTEIDNGWDTTLRLRNVGTEEQPYFQLLGYELPA